MKRASAADDLLRVKAPDVFSKSWIKWLKVKFVSSTGNDGVSMVLDSDNSDIWTGDSTRCVCLFTKLCVRLLQQES